MKILLLGKTGQVGFELHRMLSVWGSVNAPGRPELNLMSEKAVDLYLDQSQPDLIVNAAAWTAVDAAEEYRTETERLNAGLPRQLARYAVSWHARLIHYSSDYVYSGTGIAPWSEASPADSESVYGQSKLRGDEAIQESEVDYLIFRTSWIYSARGKNFMKTMLRLAESKYQLDVVSDQIGAPTPARLIAQVTVLAIHSRLRKGLYHVATTGDTSWQIFAEKIFGLTGKRTIVNPISTIDYPTPAIRPLNSRLDTSKLESELNIKLPDWESQLALTLSEYLEW